MKIIEQYKEKYLVSMPAGGKYTVYVENRSSSQTMQVTGSAMYPN